MHQFQHTREFDPATIFPKPECRRCTVVEDRKINFKNLAIEHNPGLCRIIQYHHSCLTIELIRHGVITTIKAFVKKALGIAVQSGAPIIFRTIVKLNFNWEKIAFDKTDFDDAACLIALDKTIKCT